MTATPERPLRTRAGLRAMIYRLRLRANQTPAHHSLRLQLEEELAELKAQLTEVEQYIGAIGSPKPSKLSAVTEVASIRDFPRASPASAAQGDAGYAHDAASWSRWMANEKHEPGDPDQILSIASIATRYRLMVTRSLHRAGAFAARVVASSSRPVRRMLDTVGESVIECWVIGLRAPKRFTGHARKTFSRCGSVATRNCRHAVILMQQGIVGSSRHLRLSVEPLIANGREFRAFVGRTLSRSSERLGALLGSCLVSAASLSRAAVAVIRQCVTAGVSFLHQATQMLAATSTELWGSARKTLIRTSDRINAGLGQCRVVADQGARRAYAAAVQGFAVSRGLLLRKIARSGSRWVESFKRVVVLRIADGVGAATGVGQLAARRAGAQAKRGIFAGRVFLHKVMAAAPNKGRKLSTFCRRLSIRLSEGARQALAVSRPVAIQALRNAQSATLRSAAGCQQVTLESLRTARGKWTELSRRAALAGAAIGRWAAPRLQQASAQAKRGIGAGRLFLKEVMIAAHIKGGEMLIFFRRLSLRVFDCIKKSARRLPSLRDPDLAAQDAEPTFSVGQVRTAFVAQQQVDIVPHFQRFG